MVAVSLINEFNRRLGRVHHANLQENGTKGKRDGKQKKEEKGKKKKKGKVQFKSLRSPTFG